jgi:hypothetical protein
VLSTIAELRKQANWWEESTLAQTEAQRMLERSPWRGVVNLFDNWVGPGSLFCSCWLSNEIAATHEMALRVEFCVSVEAASLRASPKQPGSATRHDSFSHLNCEKAKAGQVRPASSCANDSV